MHWVPEGRTLPDESWQRRHRGICVLLWLHPFAIPAFGLAMGQPLQHVMQEAAIVAVLAALSSWPTIPPRARSTLASIGLLSSSAILVHLSGGYIEFHFHFFVMVAVIALYQDWVPFLCSIGFVLAQHGIVGALDPRSVYNHFDGVANPWKWAAIHATFIAGASAAAIINWRLNELARQGEERAAQEASARADALAASEAEVRRLNENLERLVRERTNELAVVNEELESFAYSVSHDLRAPLRAINGFTSILEQRTADRLDPDSLRYLQRVRAASERMGKLIDDLLNLSRITRQPLDHQEVNLSDLAQSVAAELKEVHAHAAEVKVPSNLVVRGDSGLLRIALYNLMDNAWKFTRHEAEPRIEIGATRRDGRTAYYVRDNGAGFDMEHADQLFRPFGRLHGQEQFSGTGIGLATVRRVVGRHGGEVWGEGTVDEGATFYFTLPE